VHSSLKYTEPSAMWLQILSPIKIIRIKVCDLCCTFASRRGYGGKF